MAKIRKMKLYRLVQNVLSSWESYTAFESLYYSLGYTSFTGEICRGSSNKYPKDKMVEEGKFFFMFPEHAMEYLRDYPLYNDCYKFIEYEVPEDYVYDIIGVGEYGYSSPMDEKFDFPKAETYISKSLFGKAVKSSEVLTKDEKTKVYLSEMKKTINAFQVLTGIKGVKPRILEDFDCDKVEDISDDKLLDYLLENNDGRILKAFLKDDSEIVKSNFITDRSMIVHRSYRMQDKDVNKANKIILENSCFDFDYTCEYSHGPMDARYEYARLIEQHKYDEAKKLKRKIYQKKANEGKYKYIYETR